MTRHGTILGAVCAVTLAGCSVTLPVRDTLESKGEKFTGTATGYMVGAGDLPITG